MGLMLNAVNPISDVDQPYLYIAQHCMNKFCEALNDIREEIVGIICNPDDMIITAEQEQ